MASRVPTTLSRSLASTSKLAARSLSTSRVLSQAQVEQHDIVIVGGGPAGLALAAAFAASDPIASTHKITLLEASPLSTVSGWAPPPGKFSNRVSSVTAENVAYLTSIGVWPHVDTSRVRGIEEMQVWDGLSSARINFNSPAIEPSAWAGVATRTVEPMATLVENLNIQRGSLAFLHSRKDGVELIDGRKVLTTEKDEGGWPVVTLAAGGGEGERSLRARLLIGADGFNSPVKAYSKIGTFGWPYPIHGVVASLEVSPADMGEGMSTAWQRFLPEGPIAFLPLSDTAASLVWSTTPALAAAMKQLPLEVLPPLINAAFTLPYESLSQVLTLLLSTPPPSPSDITTLLASLAPLPDAYNPSEIPDPTPPLVRAVQAGSIASFPLRLSHVDSYLGLPQNGMDLRTALVGDAAHTINPLGGQGLNMGLGDVRELVRTVERTVLEGGDIGSYNSLRSYPRSRYFKNHLILSGCDHLSALYGSRSPPIVWARSTGLEIVNELESVKNLIMGGVGGSAKAGQGAGTPWAFVADAIQGVGSAVEVAKGLGAMAGQQIMERVGRGVRG
ncbi:hypothetical protein RQP46_008335 [Phenoliferia psychrophenolica]